MQNKLTLEKLLDWVLVLAITGLMAVIGNVIGYQGNWGESLAGIAWLCLFSIMGFILKELIPLDIPAVAYISIIAILFSIPASPVAETVVRQVESISLLALCTPVLAYAGVSIGKDWGAFREIGLKGILVSIITIVGTVLMCVVFAEILFRIF